MHEWRLYLSDATERGVLFDTFATLVTEGREFSLLDDRGGTASWIVVVKGGERPGAAWERVDVKEWA